MAFSDLSNSQVSRLIELIKQKEDLQSRIARINEQLSGFEKSEPVQKKKALGRRRTRRAKTSNLILMQLTKAGKAGLSVQEIAGAIGGNAPSIAVWLYTAGKKIKGLRKVAPGRFAYKRAV